LIHFGTKVRKNPAGKTGMRFPFVDSVFSKRYNIVLNGFIRISVDNVSGCQVLGGGEGY